MKVSKIKSMIIPVLLSTGIHFANNVSCTVNNQQNIDYLCNNPRTLSTEAGFIFGLFKKGRRDNEEEQSGLNSSVQTKEHEFNAPEPTNKLNISEFGYPIVSKGAKYSTKINSRFSNNATITYPNGDVKNLNDIIEKEGYSTASKGYVKFVKDSNGNIFYYNSHDDKYKYYDLESRKAKNMCTYYALSENNELYSINIEKIPEGKVLAFTKWIVGKEIIVPKGTIIKYDDTTIVADADSDFCVLNCINSEQGSYCCLSRLERPKNKLNATDADSLEKQNEVYKNAIEVENCSREELKKQNAVDDKERKLIIKTPQALYKCDNIPETEENVTQEEINFYKQVYDYYTEQNEEYKNCTFVFQRQNSIIEMKIKNGGNIIETVKGMIEKIDGPVFSNSRFAYTLGEFSALYPND